MQTMGLEAGEGHGEEALRTRASGAVGTSEGDPPLSV
jgi:hypothetical protein